MKVGSSWLRAGKGERLDRIAEYEAKKVVDSMFPVSGWVAVLIVGAGTLAIVLPTVYFLNRAVK